MRISNRNAIFVLICLLVAVSGYASGIRPEPDSTEMGEKVHLSQLVLYSSGLGYFERRGTVNGEDIVDLTFKTRDINDLLKSLVLQDLDGGQISSVNYSSREPLATVLRSLSIDLSGNPGLAAILQQVRGQGVVVTIEGGVPISGAVLGLETKQNASGRNTSYLNLRTKKGLRSIGVDSIVSFDFADPGVREELSIALQLLAAGELGDEKRISIRFSGDGKRRVRIGYLLQMPVWKTTYRLVLGDKNEHYLQGWAIVENTTEEEWDGIDLSLVSGRPISFSMDLYRPIYVTRPVVNPDVQQAVGPKISEKSIQMAPSMAAPSSARGMSMGAESMSFMDLAEDEDAYIGTGSGVDSAAQGGQSGEFFQYAIELPVSIPRKESAMVPIVSDGIMGERISIFNAVSHPSHPFNSVRITNTTGLDLKGGPVTLFEADAYAGDGILNSTAGEDQTILSYSLDLATEVQVTRESIPPEITNVSIKQGTLTVERLYQNGAKYSVQTRGLREKKIVLEHPILAGWDLVEPSVAAEKTNSYYRFQMSFDSGDADERALSVIEETVSDQHTALERMSNAQIEEFIKDVEISARLRTALLGIVSRRVAVDEVASERSLKESRRATIYRDQERIRKNMEQLAKDSDLYKRYAEQLSAQEDELDRIVADVALLIDREKRLRDELSVYISNLQA